ncbi:MAG: class I SAM-dependent methyltransferase [Desulfobacterales bacterium]
MRLNALERFFVLSPVRRAMQAAVLAWMRRAAPEPSGGRLLEIGCGGGAGGRGILRRFAPRRLVLCDLDPRMARRAARSLATEAAVRVCAADAARLPFRTGVFDAVFGFGVLHHVPEWRAAVAEIARVLRPGGLYLLEEYYPRLYANALARRLAAHPLRDRFRGPDLRQALQAAGLSCGRRLELAGGGVLAVCRRRSEPLQSFSTGKVIAAPFQPITVTSTASESTSRM